jgi:hypothetical protein
VSSLITFSDLPSWVDLSSGYRTYQPARPLLCLERVMDVIIKFGQPEIKSHIPDAN